MNNVAATFAMGDYDPTPSATEYLRRNFELALGCRLVGFSRIRPNADRRSTMRALPQGRAVLFSPLDLPWSSPFRNPVLFFEARFETLQIHRNPWLRAFRRRPEILHRPRDWLLQFSGRTQWPIRVAQKLAGDYHRVCLSRPDDVLRLHRRSDHSDRTGYDFGFAPDFLGKSRLVTGTDRNFRMGNVTAGRTID
jgi:hypothetical protein